MLYKSYTKVTTEVMTVATVENNTKRTRIT